MPALTIRDTELLADYFHGMSNDMAFKIWQLAKTNGTAYAVLRYQISRNGKTRKASIALQLTVDAETMDDPKGVIGFMITDDYHPRTYGKAELDFTLDWTYDDND
jgi:hypothetical protein